MKFFAILVLLMGTIFCSSWGQDLPEYTVYKSGTEGYKSFRIPAIVINKHTGELLAFAEGRVDGGGDYGNIQIVLKRSANGGKTWTPLQVVAKNATLQAGNPAPVLDETDPAFPKGRLFLFYNTGNGHEMEMRKGKGYRRVLYKTSIDGGNTWSDSVDITTQVNLMNKPDRNPEWNHPEDWRAYANTPGHAFQFSYGKYKGRLYVAANHSAGEPLPALRDYQAHGFYTDNHGKSFKVSESVPFEGTNESTAAQLGKNGLMMNSRNQVGTYRVVSLSKDGGATWKKTFVDQQLPDPICEGSLLNIGKKGKLDILAFCNAASQQKRDSLTLRISFDSGKTWKYSQLISASVPKTKESAAYSDLVKVSENELGILYETDYYQRIIYVPVKWK